MSAGALGEIAGRVSRAGRLSDSAGRIFVALRNETRVQTIGNDEVCALLNLADALAITVIKAADADTRETIVAARACAALDAHLAATRNLRDAIALVQASVGELTR